MTEIRVSVVIPVYHPGEKFQRLLRKLKTQTKKPCQVILMQTVSDPKDVKTFPEYETENYAVLRTEFDHGGTRNLGASYAEGDYLLFMTEDAVPFSDDFIEKMTEAFSDEKTAACYARQLPSEDASPIERITRGFNYPAEGHVYDISAVSAVGIKAFFCSNVAAMYRKDLFVSLGGFPAPTIFNEDMIFGGKALKAGYRICYAASAAVIHSHNLKFSEQFHRNFDLGVSQAEHPEIFRTVSSEKEGARYGKEVLKALLSEKRIGQAFSFCVQCLYKYAGYALGKRYRKFSKSFIIKCSLNKTYWEGKKWVRSK